MECRRVWRRSRPQRQPVRRRKRGLRRHLHRVLQPIIRYPNRNRVRLGHSGTRRAACTPGHPGAQCAAIANARRADPGTGSAQPDGRGAAAGGRSCSHDQQFPGSGAFVQVSSQRSEGEAQAAYRSLQAKYPNQLNGRELSIQKADLGSKGTYYRAMIGPSPAPTRRANGARASRRLAASAWSREINEPKLDPGAGRGLIRRNGGARVHHGPGRLEHYCQ